LSPSVGGIPDFIPGEHSESTIPLKSPDDVMLVCVVNGLANADNNHENWGRVRALRTWGDDGGSKQTAVLQSLGADNFPNPQDAGRDVGKRPMWSSSSSTPMPG
jgi:hypothetical protein